jgi:hypothetical protein
LDHAGFQTFPARTVADAATLLRELHLTVGVLMLDCALPGAVEFISALQSSRRSLQVICLNEDREHSCGSAARGLRWNPPRFSEFLRMREALHVENAVALLRSR